MRRTKDPRIALQRLRAAFPETMERLERHNGALPERRAVRQLAFVLDVLRRIHVEREAAQSAIRWYGAVPLTGVKGWEAEALAWGRFDP